MPSMAKVWPFTTPWFSRVTAASSPQTMILVGRSVHCWPLVKELSQLCSAADRPCLGGAPTGSWNTTSSAELAIHPSRSPAFHSRKCASTAARTCSGVGTSSPFRQDGPLHEGGVVVIPDGGDEPVADLEQEKVLLLVRVAVGRPALHPVLQRDPVAVGQQVA